MSIIVPQQDQKALIDPQVQRILDFLDHVGLPSDNIIAQQSERNIIGNNLPTYIQSLDPEVKRDARYLSKFVIGAGFGLFDYSLNAIWNEVILDLRKKAIAYGVDIFFDSAVGGGKTREFYKNEEDLASLKDAVLLDTCRKLELISDTTYKKLKHILDMRNDIGISHPTNYTINAFELLGWLQTCIQDVLNDRPTEAALQVQAFIKNLKTHQAPIDSTTQKTIESKISELASHHVASILRTAFGMYVAPETDIQVRKNISIIAPTLWNNCTDEPKYKLGIILEGYNTNLYKEKYGLGEQFFEVVNGNPFRSTNERIIIVDTLLDQLLEKHNGWDNFHHEAPVADSLSSYIQDQNDIVVNNVEKLVKATMICRIGRGVSYCNGVSPRGKPYYENILSQLGDKYAPIAMAVLTHYEIQQKLTIPICRVQAKATLEIIRQGVVNERLAECLDYLIARIESNEKCVTDKAFKALASQYIN
nr:hypothetical protein [Moraxella sp. CTOTU48268]